MKTITYKYFTATITGYNGSRGTKLVVIDGCWNDESEAEAALAIAADKAAQSILDRNGYGAYSLTVEEAIESLDAEGDAELIARIRAEAVDGRIAVSCGASGMSYGSQAESHGDLIGWALGHDHQRLVTTYRVIPTVNGRLIHSSAREVMPGEMPEFDSCAKLHYFQSEVEPKVGDEISIGKNGRCRVEAIVGGELQARNIHTGELFTVFADDCDLLGRAELDDQASVVVAKLLAAGRGREASSLGQIIGAWRKGHVGDCALRNAITGSERRLAQTGTPAVERAQLAEIQ